jgi:hypothetical protein
MDIVKWTDSRRRFGIRCGLWTERIQIRTFEMYRSDERLKNRHGASVNENMSGKMFQNEYKKWKKKKKKWPDRLEKIANDPGNLNGRYEFWGYRKSLSHFNAGVSSHPQNCREQRADKLVR